MQQGYKIISYSKLRAFIIMFGPILILPAIVPIASKMLGQIGEYIVGAIIIIIILIWNWFNSPKYFAKSVLEIIIDEESLEIGCLVPFYKSKKYQSQPLTFDIIESYKFEHSNNFDTLKIKLKDGHKFIIHRWYNDNNDDFDKFFSHFERVIKSRNKKKSTEVKIVRQRLIMENKIFLIIVGLVTLTLVVVTIILVFKKGITNPKRIIAVMVFLSPLIWVVRQIIIGLRK